MLMVVVAKLEELQKDMKFIGQMANVSFTASDNTDTLGGWWGFTTVGDVFKCEVDVGN